MRFKPSNGIIFLTIITVVIVGVVAIDNMTSGPDEVMSVDRMRPADEPEISAMGAIARGDVPRPSPQEIMQNLTFKAPPAAQSFGGSVPTADMLVHSPTAPDFQSETSIAKAGDTLVVGYNDWRGFLLTPTSVSGFAYSYDNGATWTDGGSLPTTGPSDPEAVFGDPDVKVWQAPNGNYWYFYSSLYATPGGLSSLCVHVSDDGANWTLRQVNVASGTDFPDKEFMDIDPETGRIFVSWTNFGASTSMRITYSDDMGMTWSAPTIFATPGQGSIPRASGGSDVVHLSWRGAGTIMYTRSTDNGVNWSVPTAIFTGSVTPMNPYGSDRINGFPSLDVDDATDDVYVVFASRNLAPDFADVYFMSSTDSGVTWGDTASINLDPGKDRVQFFPWVSVDQSDGRIDAVWYDQRIGTGSSDLTEVMHTYSMDGGATWGCVAPLTDKPFHAELGNTTSQPNIGDYIQSVSQDGWIYTAFAKTNAASPAPVDPHTYVDVQEATNGAPIKFRNFVWGAVQGCEVSNDGIVEPGERRDLFVNVEQYSHCDSSVLSIGNIQGTLYCDDPSVIVVHATSNFPNLTGVNSFRDNDDPFTIIIDPSANCGDNITLWLRLTTDAGGALIPVEFRTGAVAMTPLFAEDFDTVTAPALPNNWASTVEAGAANPWVTYTLLNSSAPNSVFCPNASVTSLNRLNSPAIAVPANCDMLDVTFRVSRNLEHDIERKAWDGALMRVEVDGAPMLAGAIAEVFTPFYEQQMNRQSSANQPLQDLACWSDRTTPAFTNVHMQFPGLGGSSIRLMWDLGTDAVVGTNEGVYIDNIVVQSIEYECDCASPTGIADETPRVNVPFEIVSLSPNPFNPSTTVKFTLPERMPVTAEVYDVSGARIRTLASNQHFRAGENELRWNGKDNAGIAVASGVYFISVETRLGREISRAVLLK